MIDVIQSNKLVQIHNSTCVDNNPVNCFNISFTNCEN